MPITRNPQTLAPPSGNYSHGVEVSRGARHLYISGQIPEKLNGDVPADFDTQCETVWHNIGEILKASGMDFKNLVKVTTYLTHPDQATRNSQIRQRILGELKPALTVVIVQTLESRWLLEIEAIAVAED
ncbi:MAG: RidA family protein [Acidobacteriota bacterium]